MTLKSGHGCCYVFWRVSQNQYYLAADSSGQVVMDRGVNYHILA